MGTCVLDLPHLLVSLKGSIFLANSNDRARSSENRKCQRPPFSQSPQVFSAFTNASKSQTTRASEIDIVDGGNVQWGGETLRLYSFIKKTSRLISHQRPRRLDRWKDGAKRMRGGVLKRMKDLSPYLLQSCLHSV